MLRYRLILGPVMIAVLLGLIYADDRLGAVTLGDMTLPPGLIVFGAFLLVIVLGAGELTAIFKAKGVETHRAVITLAGVVGFAGMYVLPRDGRAGHASAATMLTPIVIVFLLGLLWHAWRRRTQGAAAAGAAAAFAFIYIGAMPGFFMLVRQEHTAWMIAAVIMIAKNCDTGAFTAGRLFGKRKLIPWLSPGKTWEGLAGGVALSVLTAVLLAWLANANGWGVRVGPASAPLVPRAYPLWYAAIAGVLLAVVGHAGDLLASLLKRDAGVKDSGRSIPGFGGVLDVCDSPIMIAPLAYWLLHFAPKC